MFSGSYDAESSGCASDYHDRDSYYSSGPSGAPLLSLQIGPILVLIPLLVSLFKNALNTNVIDSQINVHVSHFQGV